MAWQVHNDVNSSVTTIWNRSSIMPIRVSLAHDHDNILLLPHHLTGLAYSSPSAACLKGRSTAGWQAGQPAPFRCAWRVLLYLILNSERHQSIHCVFYPQEQSTRNPLRRFWRTWNQVIYILLFT
jgi:hypothetical protein